MPVRITALTDVLVKRDVLYLCFGILFSIYSFGSQVHRFAGSLDEKISFRRSLVYISFLMPCFQAFAC